MFDSHAFRESVRAQLVQLARRHRTRIRCGMRAHTDAQFKSYTIGGVTGVCGATGLRCGVEGVAVVLGLRLAD